MSLEDAILKLAEKIDEANALTRQVISARQELVNAAPATPTPAAPAPANTAKAEKPAKAPKQEPVVLPDPEPEVEEIPEVEPLPEEDDGLEDEAPAATRADVVAYHRKQLEADSAKAKATFIPLLREITGVKQPDKVDVGMVPEDKYGDLLSRYKAAMGD